MISNVSKAISGPAPPAPAAWHMYDKTYPDESMPSGTVAGKPHCGSGTSVTVDAAAVSNTEGNISGAS